MQLPVFVKLVDITKSPHYERTTPYKFVISNLEHDFVVSTIFVVSSSHYIRALYDNSEETCEIEPGYFVPRYVTYVPACFTVMFTHIY